ncbi:hypothetical protein DB346_11535 [Verrucomicrobia bacterium LW23]|nr:hypothetical protein DB346_11535 [Verrucomicrobia bacterium LW23]
MRSLALLGFFLCLVVGGGCIAVYMMPKAKVTTNAFSGKEKDTPAAETSPGDGKAATASKPAETPARSGNSLPTNPAFKGLEGKLVRANAGQFIKAKQVDTQVKYVLVYYSAHWCPPCRMFTPKLVNFYESYKNVAKNKGVPFEVIFVSFDNSENEMEQYAMETNMSWLAVRYGAARSAGNPLLRLSGRGIPFLVLLGPDGEVLINGHGGTQQALNEMMRIVNQS